MQSSVFLRYWYVWCAGLLVIVALAVPKKEGVRQADEVPQAGPPQTVGAGVSPGAVDTPSENTDEEEADLLPRSTSPSINPYDEPAAQELYETWQQWPFPIPAPDPLPEIGDLPEVPRFPPPPLVVQAGTSLRPGSPEDMALRQYFGGVMGSCPRTEVSEDLLGMFLEGSAEMWFQDIPGAMATFDVVPEHLFKPEHRDGRGFQPRFSVSPWVITTFTSDFGIRNSWLTLYHEYIHYLQWRDGTPEEREMFVVADSGSLADVDAEFCRLNWQFEHETWSKTCLLANEWGTYINGSGPLCMYAGSGQFDAALLFSRTVSVAVRGEWEICPAIWAEMIGEPVPDVTSYLPTAIGGAQ